MLQQTARRCTACSLQAFLAQLDRLQTPHLALQPVVSIGTRLRKEMLLAGGPNVTCPAGAWTSPEANPHVLNGALVDGPQQPNDQYNDSRQAPDAYVSLAQNAGYTGEASIDVHGCTCILDCISSRTTSTTTRGRRLCVAGAERRLHRWASCLTGKARVR